VTIQKLAGAILVGVPLLAHGQTAPDDLQAMTNRQIELEKQVREQDARSRHERAGKRDALLLAARELCREVL